MFSMFFWWLDSNFFFYKIYKSSWIICKITMIAYIKFQFRRFFSELHLDVVLKALMGFVFYVFPFLFLTYYLLGLFSQKCTREYRPFWSFLVELHSPWWCFRASPGGWIKSCRLQNMWINTIGRFTETIRITS